MTNLAQLKSQPLSVLIVDDEPLAHEVLSIHLQTLAERFEGALVDIKQHCYSATEALAWLANHQVDLMFLDINMPGLNGIELLKVLANKPQVILVSAYSEFAVQGFELDVADYLLKPVSAERLQQALEKVVARKQLAQFETQPAEQNRPDTDAQSLSKPNQHIIVQVDRTQHKVPVKDILWLEAYGNYVKLWLDDNVLLVNSTLKSLLEDLQGSCAQIHKSYAVNLNKVVAVNSDFVTLQPVVTASDGTLSSANRVKVKVGKSYKNFAKSLLQ